MFQRLRPILLATVIALAASCTSDDVQDGGRANGSTPKSTSNSDAKTASAPRLGYRVVRKFPHDTAAFTQGFTVHNGAFLETTGLTGRSGIRRVEITTGKILKKVDYTYQIFGEGTCVLNNKAYAITWMNQTGFIFNAATLEKEAAFSYLGEGWGLTSDGTSLYMSNGTNVITRRDPADFHQLGTLMVTLDGSPLRDINELEWINGEIWANIWKTEHIVRIDPQTGVVKGLVDLTGILPRAEMHASIDVMNGIAFDQSTQAVYVTGKNWPWVYQIVVD